MADAGTGSQGGCALCPPTPTGGSYAVQTVSSIWSFLKRRNFFFQLDPAGVEDGVMIGVSTSQNEMVRWELA